jgi:AcrR family transcriptional regulator
MASLAERRRELLDSMMREAVFDGAVEVLTAHGLGGTTMDRVAAAAGMAKGSLYKCFHTKRELLEFVHERACAPMHRAVGQVVESTAPATEKLELIVRLWREYLVEHHAVFEFLINDRAAKGLLQDSEQDSRATGVRHIGAIIEQGIGQGVFRSVDATAVAEMFVGAAIGMVEQEFARGESRPVDQAVESLMGVFLGGLRAEGVRRVGVDHSG